MNTLTSVSGRSREAIRGLDDLVGHWHTSGHVVTDGTRISGTDTYEWLPGGTHVAHYVDVVVGERAVRALEILSPDPGTGGVVARAFDDAGTIEIMTATADAEGTWCFLGGADVAAVATPPGGERDEVRAILRVDRAGGHMSAKWQRFGPEGWVDWMDMRFTLRSDERVPFEHGEPVAAMRALAPLTGTWSWASRAGDGNFEVIGRTSFEWLPGGHFLLERGALTFEGVTSHSLAVVRADSGRYSAQYFDDTVGHDEYTLELHADGRFDIDWERYRFRGRFDATGDVIHGTWEQRPGEEWIHWYDAELRRLSADPPSVSESDEAAVRRVIEEWASAVRRKDMPGVLRHHAPGIVMFDVPQPLQSQGIAAYAKTWDLFFAWAHEPVVYDITTMDVVVGGEVAFVVATMRCNGHEPDGTDLELDFRLTVGLRKVAGQWTVVHEHHSIPADATTAAQEDKAMKPVTVVVSVPVTDLERTLRFYREGLGVEATGPDEGIITIELPNLSLFLIEQGEYAGYTDRAHIGDRGKPAPGAFIFSCAIGSKDEVRRTVEQAERAGGTIPGPAQDQDGSFIGFVSDPDGHLWELVANAHTEKAAAEAG